MYNDNTFGPTLTVLAVIGLLGFLAFRCNMNYGGANHAHAVKEAHAYVEQLRKSGVSAEFDCAGAALVWENHGCKEYVAKMRRE